MKNNFDSKQHQESQKQKWYEHVGVIICAIIFCFPFGLFLMWKYATWKQILKTLISVVMGFWGVLFLISILALLFSPSSSLKSIIINADTSIVYDINDDVHLEYLISDSSEMLPTEAFHWSGGNLVLEDDGILKFSSDKEGVFEIWAEHTGIKSNLVMIRVEDKTALQQEQEKELAEMKAEMEESIREEIKEEARIKAEEEKAAAEAKAAEGGRRKSRRRCQGSSRSTKASGGNSRK